MTEKKEEKKEKEEIVKKEEVKVESSKEEKKEKEDTPKKEAKPEAPKVEKEEKATVELSKKAEEIIKGIESLSVLELADLVKVLEEKFGVSSIAPVAMAVPGAVPGAPPVEEKTTFDVILKEVGPQKIQVIKVVRSLTELGLKEAKALVDGAPKPVKTGIPKEEAEEVKKKLEEVGAKVELK
ncbi:50S ribosomal protein L7/L12 [bacterium]|nr:50S ribosomal protein L7/L12 [bacterium]MBU4310191.1 50S ribosomal protein L7/L12 [bacterium]MBU4561056.1 50S ribosomal protein L7/L12 [bacterium]